MRHDAKYTIMNAVSRLTATFTAATTDICTAASHGLSNGDAVVLTTTTTLPGGLSANTVYYVIEATTNTFKLALAPGEAAVNITSTGTGTHTFTVNSCGNAIMVEDFKDADLVLATSGMGSGDTFTVKVQGSSAETCPNFHLTKSATNEWDYIQTIDLEDGSSIDGDTGITFSDSDDLRKLAVNVDGLRYINVIITAQSDTTNTSITVTINLYND